MGVVDGGGDGGGGKCGRTIDPFRRELIISVGTNVGGCCSCKLYRGLIGGTVVGNRVENIRNSGLQQSV